MIIEVVLPDKRLWVCSWQSRSTGSFDVEVLPSISGCRTRGGRKLVITPDDVRPYPPGMTHYAYAEGERMIQLNSAGPWTITYVRDEDDPRV